MPGIHESAPMSWHALPHSLIPSLVVLRKSSASLPPFPRQHRPDVNLLLNSLC